MSEYEDLVGAPEPETTEAISTPTSKPGSAHGAQGDPETTDEPPRKQSRVRGPQGGKKTAPPRLPAAQCPRWMHHRKDVYCKTCGRTP